MTKEEYLSKLRQRLQGFDQEIIEEIMQDYEEHFNLGYAQHKSDEEIIASLGSIDELIKEMEQCYERHQKNSIYIDFSDLNSSLSELKRSFKDLGENLKNEFKDMNFNFSSDDFADFEVHDLSSENEFGEAMQRFTFPDTVRSIKVNGFYGEIEVRPGDELAVEYECEGSKKTKLMSPLCTNVQDDELTIQIENLHTYGHIVKFSPDMRLFLYVPEFIETLSFNNCSDDITIEEVHLEQLDSKLAGSCINIRESQIKKCSCTTASGDMRIENCEIDSLALTTSSGELEVLDCELAKATLAAKSGDIQVIGGSSRMIVANSISGDVQINSEGCEAYAINTTSGDIQLTISNECAMQLNSVSGDVEVYLLASINGFVAAASTVSGDINICFDDLDKDDLPNGIYQYAREGEEMEVKIKAKTTSGDIYIHE